MPMKMEQSVPKRRHIKSRRRVITQKKAYNLEHVQKNSVNLLLTVKTFLSRKFTKYVAFGVVLLPLFCFLFMLFVVVVEHHCNIS